MLSSSNCIPPNDRYSIKIRINKISEGLIFIGLIALFWWLEGGFYLKFVVLFLGVMASLQSLWDFQGLMCYRIPESDVEKFAEMCRCCPPKIWAFIWMIISLASMAGFALLGVIAFNNDRT